MKLSKRQVRGIYDILKQAERKGRLRFVNLWVQDGYTYATDTHTMVRIKTTEASDGVVPFEAVEKWYKLASAKDFMTIDFIIDNLDKDVKFTSNLKDVFGDPNKVVTQESFSVDMKLVNNVVNAVSHDKRVKITLGNLRQYISDLGDTNGDIVGLVLGIKV